jgi:membrane peptidoglycan carboxypeptidase
MKTMMHAMLAAGVIGQKELDEAAARAAKRQQLTMAKKLANKRSSIITAALREERDLSLGDLVTIQKLNKEIRKLRTTRARG